ncbi:TetR/AcrR family transcriptional regulator [Lentibacillus saliphilus]|uniref:TetR/AcrR family transcriptional regulator n=1 Tax=Lentibacillus saliphilus TaxID=2737028 RepID=UPI001C2FD586|nr:TetR/AcrR family transcriptional regulator [Lentibacillus saliphilus]
MNPKSTSRDKLILTASKLFQLQGYHATGLNQITKESGAPKGSLYYHFPGGKEELAMESVRATARFVADKITEGLNVSSDPVEALQGFILNMADLFEVERFKAGVPIASIALETSLISERLRQECQASYQLFQRMFANKLIEADYEEKRAEELSVVINAMLEGAFLTSFTMGHSEPLRLVAKQVPVLLK